jgi:acetamidase/formamidase
MVSQFMSSSHGPAKNFVKMRCLVSVLSSLLLAATASSLDAQTRDSSTPSSEKLRTVHYELKFQDLKYVFGPFPPVLRVHAGDIIDTTTVDADGKALEEAGLKVMGPNPLTGPFHVEEAEPGDTLVVRFLTIDPNSKQGFGAAGPGFGALNSSHYTPMLGASIPPKSWVYPIDKSENIAIFHANDSDFSVKIPLHPFLGCVGVAPADGEARSSIVPAEFGGNMDAPEASEGNTLYLPVNVPGALLFFGDGHAAMGDGEVAGTAIEVSMRVRLEVDVVKKQKIAWPRFENDDYIMAVGIYRPLDDALRIAFAELVRWIHERYGLSEMDAYELLSKTAEIHLDEMVDPNYVIVAKINKKFLPAATTRK